MDGEQYQQEASGNADVAFTDRIALQQVGFSYGREFADALNQVSLEIQRNESVAIVGPSGAGKSTLIDIILGLSMPTSGQLSVDGRIIDAGNINAWRRHIALVPQQIHIVDDTIRANIAFGIPVKQIDEAKLHRAAEMAQIADFIASLPEGYQTFAGDRGIRLSGGQRQRIGIARALYNAPSLLILDEATSALDGITEREIRSAISALKGKLTMVIIAHRISTVRDCDTIHVLQSGQVVDSGNYQELLNRSETFRALAGSSS